MNKAVYIISHEEDGSHGYGAFRSVEFHCLNTSFPSVNKPTVTYRVLKMDGEIDYVTVGLVHSIQPHPEKL